LAPGVRPQRSGLIFTIPEAMAVFELSRRNPRNPEAMLSSRQPRTSIISNGGDKKMIK